MPMSTARVITVASDVIMVPYPTVETFSPVLPRVRYVILPGFA